MALAARLALKNLSFKASMRHEVMGAASPKGSYYIATWTLWVCYTSHGYHAVLPAASSDTYL